MEWLTALVTDYQYTNRGSAIDNAVEDRPGKPVYQTLPHPASETRIAFGVFANSVDCRVDFFPKLITKSGLMGFVPADTLIQLGYDSGMVFNFHDFRLHQFGAGSRCDQ